MGATTIRFKRRESVKDPARCDFSSLKRQSVVHRPVRFNDFSSRSGITIEVRVGKIMRFSLRRSISIHSLAHTSLLSKFRFSRENFQGTAWNLIRTEVSVFKLDEKRERNAFTVVLLFLVCNGSILSSVNINQTRSSTGRDVFIPVTRANV